MRTLRFIVDGQVIKQDPNCDFTGLVPGTEKYLEAEFTFSPEWSSYAKAAAFWSVMGKEYMPQILKDGCGCLIPKAALAKRTFKVQVVGMAGDLIVRTNKVAVCQNGGRE